MVKRISVVMAAGALTFGTALAGAAPAAESTPTSFSATDKAGDVKIAKGARKTTRLKVLRSTDIRAVSLTQLDADTARVKVTFKRKPRSARAIRTLTLDGYPSGEADSFVRIKLSDSASLTDPSGYQWDSANRSVTDGYNLCFLYPKVTGTTFTADIPVRCGWDSIKRIELRSELYRVRSDRSGDYLKGAPLAWDQARFRTKLVWQP